METQRINRFLAGCGRGSRRAVESLVREGRVRVNGETIRDLSVRVDPENDLVEVDGQPARLLESGHVLLLHKPPGVVSSLVRQDQRPCILDILPERWRGHRLFHVGRLDQDSSGLLLLSDDGDLGQALLHPSHPVWKTYRLRIRPSIDAATMLRLGDGSIILEGRPVLPARVRRLGDAGRMTMLEIALREGRNRQIRRMIEAVGSRVMALQRTGFGPVLLGDLAEGACREATAPEYSALYELVPPRH